MLELVSISKKVDQFRLTNITFSVDSGAYLAVLGVSGAGKSMMLEIIAGLRKPDTGKIIKNGEDITNRKPNKRKIGLVFQENTVFPHLTVRQNIAYSLLHSGLCKSDIRKRVNKWAEVTSITDLLARGSAGLSGGETKRVALARTLAMDPEIVLLDEPFSSLDVLLHSDMLQLLQRINAMGKTVIHVTHDFNEAYALAGKMIILHEGRIEQIASPKTIYENPCSRFVAAITGSHNYFSYVKGDEPRAIIVQNSLHLVADSPAEIAGDLFIEEENILIVDASTTAQNVFPGKVLTIIPSPKYHTVVVDSGIEFYIRIASEKHSGLDIKIGDTVFLHVPPQHIQFPSRHTCSLKLN